MFFHPLFKNIITIAHNNKKRFKAFPLSPLPSYPSPLLFVLIDRKGKYNNKKVGGDSSLHLSVSIFIFITPSHLPLVVTPSFSFVCVCVQGVCVCVCVCVQTGRNAQWRQPSILHTCVDIKSGREGTLDCLLHQSPKF